MIEKIAPYKYSIVMGFFCQLVFLCRREQADQIVESQRRMGHSGTDVAIIENRIKTVAWAAMAYFSSDMYVAAAARRGQLRGIILWCLTFGCLAVGCLFFEGAVTLFPPTLDLPLLRKSFLPGSPKVDSEDRHPRVVARIMLIIFAEVIAVCLLINVLGS